MEYDQITEAIMGRLASDGTFDVQPYAYELASEKRVEELARRLAIKPTLLVNVGEPVSSEVRDTTGRVTRDTIPVEVIVAHRNRRDVMKQRAEAKAHAWTVRKLLQAGQIGADNFADSALLHARTEHNGTTPGITLYSVFFNLTGLVDADY